MNVEREIRGGEEIRHSYGNLSDAQLIQTFGFYDLPSKYDNTDFDNPHNTVRLSLDEVVRAAHAMAPALGINVDIVERVQHLQSYGHGNSHFSLPFSSPVTDELLTFVQVRCWEAVMYVLQCMSPTAEPFVCVHACRPFLCLQKNFQSMKTKHYFLLESKNPLAPYTNTTIIARGMPAFQNCPSYWTRPISRMTQI